MTEIKQNFSNYNDHQKMGEKMLGLFFLIQNAVKGIYVIETLIFW